MSNETERCPFCGNDMPTIAIQCEYCGRMLHGSSGGGSQSEEILADVAANLFRGIEGVGGRLKITSRRVLFEPHALNLQKISAEILLSDIKEVSESNTMGLIPNGMTVRTKAGVEYKFVVWGREKLISLIESRIRRP